MKWTAAKAIVLLPATVTIYVLGAILWVLADTPGALSPAEPAQVRFWIGTAMAVDGLFLAAWTMALFDRIGKGTPAPWAPPKKLVVLGPYRHVRNPMNSGMLLMIGAEALLFGSWHLAVWACVFFAVCAIYFPCYEEPGLERRFGDAYRQYKANVPRWIPRLRPWEAPL
ncbi:MAG: isoprenylcysteine carboxylmethyltransferase family protein [Gemmatimonadetes bacterium]|nr:isoprenylcysteine carboxylmethyltransferase family protein [Gemmatimonadota bacterium]